MSLVIDASIAIKLYVNEDDSSLALAWVSSGQPLYAPDIFLVEVAQALLRHAREGRLGTAELLSALAELRRNVHVPFASGQLLDRGLELAQTLRHRLHDCMYLALAERLASSLLTADERLARKVASSALAMPIHLHTDPAP